MGICKLCGGNIKISGVIPGYIEPTEFTINYCTNCGVSYSDIPSNYILSDLYDSIYKSTNLAGGYQRYENYSNNIKKAKNPLNYLSLLEPQYQALKQVLKTFKREANILEIGSGLGYATYALRRTGYLNSFGCDLSKEAVKKARTIFGDYYISPFDLGENKYDLVFATEVIEHCIDPEDFIKSNLKLLKPGGTLLITTPRSTVPSYEFQNIKNIWISDPPPVHLWCFSLNSLEILGKRVGVKHFEVINTPLRNSIFGKKALATNRKHVISLHKLECDNLKVVNILKIILKSLTEGFWKEDIRCLYAIIINKLKENNSYVFLPKGKNETIAVVFKK